MIMSGSRRGIAGLLSRVVFGTLDAVGGSRRDDPDTLVAPLAAIRVADPKESPTVGQANDREATLARH
jgi:hypothetical protein